MKKLILTQLIVSSVFIRSYAQQRRTPLTQPPVTEQAFTSTDERLLRIFRAGNEALISGNYAEAIALFDQGIALDPKQPGFWINKANAYMLRGMTGYNLASTIPDEVARRSGIEAARQDFREAAKAANKGVEIA